jgi:signal transduction histidine kinase
LDCGWIANAVVNLSTADIDRKFRSDKILERNLNRLSQPIAHDKLLVVTNMNLPTFTLLIVEDIPANRELYRNCLLTDVSCTYDLLETESVAEGLELCQTRSIDAVLLDYLLPDGDGLKFLETLSERSNESSPAVVMMTGHGDESIAVQAMKLGAQDYLPKHKFTPQLLVSTIQSAIENTRLRLQLQQSEERLQAERLATERERKRAQAAQENRIQELQSFVHTVSHDLKAPLRAITNLSEWIEADLEGALTVATQQQMTLLRSRVERMSDTIDGLLARALSDRTDGADESVEVARLLAEVIDSLSPPSTFCIDIAPMPIVTANRLRLFQVFANLIGNSIKHHHRSDGSIRVAVREREDLYEFSVADDGVGIAPEQHERIFGMFETINPQNRSDSTGIGLAIVKKIIESQGGTIWLESQLGRGATFYFTWKKHSD